jgi:hypothetical protein
VIKSPDILAAYVNGRRVIAAYVNGRRVQWGPIVAPQPTEQSAPLNSVLPSIAGETVTGSVLTATPGAWTGNPTPTVTGQWERYSAGAFIEISGATAATYTTAHDGAHRYRENASNGVLPNAIAYSAEITVGTTANPPTLVTAPIMSGNAYTGSTIHVLPGVWDGAGTLSFAYQPQARAGATATWGNFTGSNTFVPDTARQYKALVTATGDGGVSDPVSSNTMTVADPPSTAITKTFTGTTVDTEITAFDAGLTYFPNPNATENLIVQTATNAVHAGNTSGSMQGVYPNTRAFADRQRSRVTIHQTDSGSQVVAFVRGVDYANILWVQAGAGGSTLVQKVAGATTNYPLGTVFADGDVVELEINAAGTQAIVKRNGVHLAGSTPSPITLTTTQPVGGVPGAGLWSTVVGELGSFREFTVEDFTAATQAPELDYAPRLIGDATVGATLRTTYGVWFAAPEPTYAIGIEKWNGSAWVAAPGTNTTVDYLTSEAGDYRSTVTATNAHGSRKGIGPAVTVTGGSVGTGNYVSGSLLIDDTNGAPEPAIARIEFLSGGVVVGGTAFASSEAGAQYAASNALDSDSTTVWSPMLGVDDVPHLGVSFTSPATFDAVAITAANLEALDASATPRSMRVQASDGTTQTTIRVIENETGWAPGERRVFTV